MFTHFISRGAFFLGIYWNQGTLSIQGALTVSSLSGHKLVQGLLAFGRVMTASKYVLEEKLLLRNYSLNPTSHVPSPGEGYMISE